MKGSYSFYDVFVNPSNVRTDKSTPISKEIKRVYDVTGDKAIMPQTAPYTLTYKRQSYKLTPEEMNEWQKTSGKYITSELNSIIDTEEYKSKTDEEKAKILADVSTKGSEFAKNSFLYENEVIADQPKQTEVERINSLYDTRIKESTYNAYTKLGITDDELSKLIKAKGDEKADTLDNLNSLKDLDIEKRRLYAASLYSLSKESREKVKRYVLDLDISKEEKINILKELKGFTVNTEKGTVKLN
jgi:hypothetical protein